MKYSKRRINRRKTRKNRGGFFNTKVAPLEHCNSDILISQMNNLKNPDITDEDFNRVNSEMENTYKECCPKKFGFKNTSSFCKQLQQNHKTAAQAFKMHQTYKYADLSPQDMFNMEQKYELDDKKDIAKMNASGGKQTKRRQTKRRQSRRRMSKRSY